MLTFVQIKASNLGLQGDLLAVQALSLIALKGLMSWNKLRQIFTFSHQWYSGVFWLLLGKLKASESLQVYKGLAVNWAF